MTQQVRVLVVDDSTFMRGALVRMIEKDSRFKVIDVASNGKEGVEKCQALKPDVVTMDVEMPVMTGLEALKEIMATVKTPVVMVSTLTEAGAETTLKALELGAVDFLPKSLSDKDKNIFKGADGLHDKLLAAAGVANGRVEKVAEAVKVSLKAPLPAVSNVVRVDVKLAIIGSSTGGPKALQQVLMQLPKTLSVPVVIVQHMPAQFTTALAKRLDESCPIEVCEAKNGETLMPGKAYIAPGGMHLRLTATGVQIDEDKGESPYKPSVGVLTESALAVFGKYLLGVMLTGMGNDGAKEFKKIKDLGGHVISQDQASCVVFGMPKAVLELEGANEVLSLDKIGMRIRNLLG